MGTVKHVFVSGIADGADATLVRPSNWNDSHQAIVQAEAYLGPAARSGRFYLPSYRSVIVADTPASYWRLDETIPPIAYDQMGAVNGTYTPPPTQAGLPSPWYPLLNQAGSDGLGVRFTTGDLNVQGKNHSIVFGDNYDLTSGSFSIECWFWIDAYVVSGQTSALLSKFSPGLSGWKLGINTGSGLFFSIDLTNTTGPSVPTTGAWHHAAFVLDKTAVTRLVYLDGVDGGTFSSAPSPTNSTAALTFGMNPDDVQPFQGLLDEVAIYTSALSATQVLNHYHAGTPYRKTLSASSTRLVIDQSAGPYTNKGTLADEAQMDGLTLRGDVLSDGTIRVDWSSQTYVGRHIKMNYVTA